MGWMCYLYVLQAKNYHKHLRPVLRNIYGEINRQKVVQIQKKVINISDTWANLHRLGQKRSATELDLESSGLPISDQDERRNYDDRHQNPLRTYLRQSGGSEFWGIKKKNQQKLCREILKKYATPVYDDVYGYGTGLMRISDMVHTIDSYDAVGSRTRICNMQQVEDQIRFLEVVEEAYKRVDSNASHYFKDTKETRTVFNDVLTLMKKQKQEPLLYYEISQ